MNFRKYQHVEKLGSVEVEGILKGKCVIMPKIDGTNSSVWVKDDGTLGFGSRNRELSLAQDNAGFMALGMQDKALASFFGKYPNLRLYGEFLTPHTIKGYTPEAWKKFYVFDVMDEADNYVPYDVYVRMLEECGIKYIPALAVLDNPTQADLLPYLEPDKNNFLLTEGQVAEGIVIHRYDFVNVFGQQVWAKIVTADFKARKNKAPTSLTTTFENDVEARIVERFATEAFIKKEYNKILEEGDWGPKKIAQLLETVFYELINEEMYHILKEFRLPVVDFKRLRSLTVVKIKLTLPELF